MSLFLISYLAIYGGMHIYVCFRTVRAFGLDSAWSAVLALVCAFMVFAPVFVRLLLKADAEAAAHVVAWFGYSWMGFFFLFFSTALALDLLRGALWLAGVLLRRDLSLLSSPAVLTFSLALAVFASVFGFFDARKLRVERVTLESPKLKSPLRLVQISDVHLGLIVGRERLSAMLDQVAALKPDLLVSTGDLVDAQVDRLNHLAVALQQVQPPLGKFAVTGNHEVLAGLAPSVGFIRRSGFNLLRQDAAHVAGLLTVVGVDDPMVHDIPISESSLLKDVPRDRFTLLLKHRPTVDAASSGLFDLQLSGHVHKGQIFPFNFVTRLFYPAPTGLSRTISGSFLYVSRGTGTWGPPIRFLAPPEITVFDLVPASK